MDETLDMPNTDNMNVQPSESSLQAEVPNGTESNSRKPAAARRRYRKRINLKTNTDNESRFCTIVDNDQLKKIRIIARREGLNVKIVVAAAFDKAIRNYERKHGEIAELSNNVRDLFL